MSKVIYRAVLKQIINFHTKIVTHSNLSCSYSNLKVCRKFVTNKLLHRNNNSHGHSSSATAPNNIKFPTINSRFSEITEDQGRKSKLIQTLLLFFVCSIISNLNFFTVPVVEYCPTTISRCIHQVRNNNVSFTN